MKNKLTWSFYQVWNESLADREFRKIEPRSEIWASELGKSYVDNYLKIKGVQPTNPPNPRSLRKFEAGNFFEWMVGIVLKRAGIYLGSQDRCEYKLKGCLPVAGKLDFLAGGKGDWKKAREAVDELDMPEFIERSANAIIDHFESKWGDKELKKIVLEIKSCSSFMFEKYLNTGVANHNHRLQLFHYLKASGLDEGHIVYISKDDLRMLEFGIFNPSPVEEEYNKYVKELSGYLLNDEQPPREKSISFNEESGKLECNWKVMYSLYLTKLYGFADQKEYDDTYRKLVSRWNRVLKRIKDGENITKDNLEAVAEMEDYFGTEEISRMFGVIDVINLERKK